ncbi:MAG TPA: hypothetical protein VGI64_13955 [Streptosporangiaceae bacterium]|jgi:hypothetical protein
MDELRPALHWVREDNHDVAINGAVLAGKLVRLQARWQHWGSYLGPERFSIRTARSRFGPGRRVEDFWADTDGPPLTHSTDAWQTGRTNHFGQQQRYHFEDAHRNRSGPLIVSNVSQYTAQPRFGLQASGTLGLPAGAQARLIAEAGRAATKIMVGATADPAVRVTIMTTSGAGDRDDLLPYLRGFILEPSDPAIRLLASPGGYQWQPVFDSGDRHVVLNIDEDHPAEVTIVPAQPYEEHRRPFMTGFAIRAEDLDDPGQFVISDVVTVEGGTHDFYSRQPSYPEGSVLLRAE